MGLFIAKTLGKGRGLGKDNLQRNMVLAGWCRMTAFTIVSKAVPRNVPGCGNVIGYPVNMLDFLGTLLACSSSHLHCWLPLLTDN